MQDGPLQDVIEDDDFFGDADGVTAPAPGKKLGAYVGTYGDSGLLPETDTWFDSTAKQNFSPLTTFLLFVCLIVMVIGAIFLICMFIGFI